MDPPSSWREIREPARSISASASACETESTMEMKHSLHLSQKPALIMTPRLQQALKLLQVPTLELQQILKQEVMQNPLLEEVDELTENDDLAKEDSPDEAANQEAEDPAEEDPIDWSEYMQDGSFDR